MKAYESLPKEKRKKRKPGRILRKLWYRQAQELEPDEPAARLSLSPGLRWPRSHDHVTENVPEAPDPLKRDPAIGPR